MKLYYLKGACSLSSYIALCETGLKFEATAIDRQTKKTADGEDFTKVNPKGYAPALRLDNGEVLTENVAVLQYIADQAPDSKLAPANGTIERYRLVEWLAFINSEVHKAMSPLFVPTVSEDTKNFARGNVTRRLDWLDTVLAKKQFLTGDNFTVADSYLWVVLGWLPHVGFDRKKWASLEAFYNRIASRPAVQQALKGEGLA